MRNPNRTAAKRRKEAAGDTSNKYDAIIVYNSEGGATMEYAKWLSEALDCDLVPYSRKNLAYVSLYKTVIFGSWIRAGEIVQLKLLKHNDQNFNLESRNVFIFGVGIAPSDDVEYVDFLKERNGVSELFYLPGRYEPSKAKTTATAALKALSGTMYDPYSDSVTEVMQERFENGYNGVDKAKLLPIVEAVIKAYDEQ